MWLLALVVLVWQRDLGTAMLFFIVFLLLLYVTSGDWRILLGGCVLILLAGIAGYQLFDVVRLRVDIWLNPWLEADGRAYQIVQSLMAFAAGAGWAGRAWRRASRAISRLPIPISYSPPWLKNGVCWACWRCWAAWASWLGAAFTIAMSHPGAAFHKLLAIAFTLTLLAQALMIMAGALKLLPLTGVTLPFISYGGSSLLACHLMLGLAAASFPLERARCSSSRRSVICCSAYWASLTLLAAAASYWALVGRDTLLAREDNPRRIEELARIQRGDIFDRRARILAQTVAADSGLARRLSPAIQLQSSRLLQLALWRGWRGGGL